MPGNGAPSEGLKRVDPEAIDTIVAAHAGHEGALLPVLREVQEVVGYLPEWALKRVALGLGLSLSRVYGVATFYSLFTTKPKGQYVIRVCESAPCHVQGAQEVINALMRELGVGFGETTPDGRFTLEAVSCLGTCGVAPAVMIGDRVYGNLTPETVLTVLEEYS
ncbi:MAG: NADH-quinone oxidoreductase subunit NuoE [Bacillota bacterium]|nr:MAG: NADH-quinone oxidoreductase subunit NuoE [Bacillota bacterium]